MPALGEPQSQNLVQWLVRTAVFVVFFAGQSAALNFSQFLSLLLWPFSHSYYQSYIKHTQRCFGILLVAINQFFAPSNFVITVDKSAKGVLKQSWNGAKVELDMPERLILIANHQIYADWLYVWCFTYLANAHGAIKIILKDSLKWLPIFGWGMQFFQYIFLKRNWATDKGPFSKTLSTLATSKEPLWLLIFPEGTVVSDVTRITSKKYADKVGLVDHEHVLLPRSTGLHFCARSLHKSVDYVYDLTIGIEGVRRGQFPEEIYTLRNIYFEGQYPRNIHLHIRKYAISEMPEDEDKFTEWLRQRWIEKDALMEEFYTKGRFTGYESPRTVPMKLNSVFELTQIWYFIVPLVPIMWYFSNYLLNRKFTSSFI
ncbi:acyltransferase [Rhizophagus irregularis]|uniref:Acyltransferase n=1 Tax=Rhizophagus irregularis TaxID=588596 RepID=A0A2I1GPM5_9GLOM|nr:acyltransferase [Rhizophagus irregularis]